jgi:hypothetical protein
MLYHDVKDLFKHVKKDEDMYRRQLQAYWDVFLDFHYVPLVLSLETLFGRLLFNEAWPNGIAHEKIGTTTFKI